MIVARYIFPRGATICVPLDFKADAGETTADVIVTAWMRRAGFQPGEVTDDMPKIAEFSVETRSDNTGWLLTLSDTVDLAPGFYVTDIRMTDGLLTEGEFTFISDRVALIEITIPVTGGA